MRKLLLVICVLFVVLTIVGAGYVLINKGQVNAGYAVIPMLFALASSFAYRKNSQR